MVRPRACKSAVTPESRVVHARRDGSGSCLTRLGAQRSGAEWRHTKKRGMFAAQGKFRRNETTENHKTWPKTDM